MFPNVNRAFQLLQAWMKYPRRQAALTRKIVDRIRNSLELQVVLQTAVDEVATLLELDGCNFFWYFEDTKRVKVVCEHQDNRGKTSDLGYHPLKSFGEVAFAIATGKLIVNSGIVRSNGTRIGGIIQWMGRLLSRLSQPLKDCYSLSRHEESYFVSGQPCEQESVSDRSGEAVATLGDWALGEHHQSNGQVFGYSASLLIPVSGQEGRIGFIACLSNEPRVWAATDIEFLQSIADPLEIAIRQAQLYEQTQKQAIRERLVNQITSQTRQSFDPETILTEASAQLLEALQADRCLVHLVELGPGGWGLGTEDRNNSEGDAFPDKHLYEVCRPPFVSLSENFDPYGPITHWVIQHRQGVMIPDITQDERIGEANQEYQKAQIKSSLVVPVQANGTLHALLYLNQCTHNRYWSKNDQKLAQAVADQLAISLQQAYLYARTQQQAAHSATQAKKLSEMIEELRLTQAQLIQNEKMSSLGRMVAAVAHEINNPINFIYGNIPYVETYVNDLIRLVQAYQSHYPTPDLHLQKLAEETEVEFLLRDLPKILKSMQLGAERIHEIVQLLQKFSSNNVAPVKLVDLNTALENTLLILHNQISGQIEVERNYDHLPPVECYPKSLNQALLSILTNAIEALDRSSNPNKIITLQTKWIPSSEHGDEGRVQIAIADTGAGIKLEIQPRIFEPFFTTKDVGQGRGLGLTMSYQTIVHQHNGHLEVKSQPNRGTEFILELPVRHSTPLTKEPPLYKPMTTASQPQSPTTNWQSVAATSNS